MKVGESSVSDDREKLQLEGSLSLLVTVKLNLPESKAQPCYVFQVNPPIHCSSKLKKQHHTTIKWCVHQKTIAHLQAPDNVIRVLFRI